MCLKACKKKKGFALVETIIIFMIIIVIANISLKFILNNHLRANEYCTYSDGKSLTIEEEEYLEVINKKIMNNEEFMSSITDLSKEISRENPKFKDYYLEKINNNYYIAKVKRNSKMYIGLEEQKDREYKFSPSTYKTQYIYGGG